ncbi:MAG: hypothetical protein U5K27_00380 [Desulfotignum sp.]|nr:hypothetical protein [Desulfotignum sp.]
MDPPVHHPFFVVIAYTIFFHASVCHLFYPAQVNAGVEPWWISFADTGSANFSLGVLLCALFWAVSSDLLWEGYPFKLLAKKDEGNFFKGNLYFFCDSHFRNYYALGSA